MPVWYRPEPDENGEAVQIFRGTVWEMAQALDEAKVDIQQLEVTIGRLREFIEKRVHDTVIRTKCGYHGRRLYLEAERILNPPKEHPWGISEGRHGVGE